MSSRTTPGARVNMGYFSRRGKLAQRRDLDEVRHAILTEAISPVTVNAIARLLNTDYPQSGVHVQQLEMAGFLQVCREEPNKPASYIITNHGKEFLAMVGELVKAKGLIAT